MCGITIYKNQSKEDAGFTYVFDIYTQNFVVECIKKIKKYQGSKLLLEHSEGGTWLHKDKLDEITREILNFLPETNKQKAIQKIQKLIKRIDKPDEMDAFDVDKMMDIAMEEYFELKKKNYKTIQKGFAKLYESENGLISFEDILTLLNDCMSTSIQLTGKQYPGDFTKLRTFMYAMTCSKNSLDTSCKDFLSACMKFGIDCPYPFIITLQEKQQPVSQQSLLAPFDKQGLNKIQLEEIKRKESESEEFPDQDQSPTKQQKQSATDLVEMSSTLFAQHFSILRELRQYCQQFKQAVKTELDQEALWKHFDNILNILEAGCQFLNFPVNV